MTAHASFAYVPVPPSVWEADYNIIAREYKWGDRQDGPFVPCHEYKMMRDEYEALWYLREYQWDGTAWVLGPRQYQFTLPGGYSIWRRVEPAETRLCPLTSSDDQGLEERVAQIVERTYVHEWRGQWLEYTVSSGVEFEVIERTLEGGEQVLVFQTTDGVELLLSEADLSDLMNDSTTLTSADPILAEIAASLRVLTDSSEIPSTETYTCAVIQRSETGAAAIDLDAEACATVSGGLVAIAWSEHTLELALGDGREWLIFNAPLTETAEASAIWIVDTETVARLMLDPTTGAELGRLVPAAASEVGPLFNAISTSVQTTETGTEGGG